MQDSTPPSDEKFSVGKVTSKSLPASKNQTQLTIVLQAGVSSPNLTLRIDRPVQQSSGGFASTRPGIAGMAALPTGRVLLASFGWGRVHV